MTKTSAARRFAAKYGIWSPPGCLTSDGEYTLAERPGRTISDLVDRSRLTNAQHEAQMAYKAQCDALDQHEADLKAMMALLDVEGQYVDTIENVLVRTGSSYLPSYYEDRVTKTATKKFAEDLREAMTAVQGQAALKRIRKAIKTVTKEESE